jgi:plastocyanin
MYVEPGNVTVDLGDEVTLRVKNVDRVFHDIALLDYDGNDVEIEVPAGKTETHTFTATVAGDFRMICEVSGHKQKGMFGFLHVVDPGAKKESPAFDLPLLAAGLTLAALVARRRP